MGKDINLIDVGVIISDSLDKIIHINCIAEEILGIKDCLGKKVGDIVSAVNLPNESDKCAFQVVVIDCKEIVFNTIRINKGTEYYSILVVYDLNRKSYSIPETISFPVENFLEFADIISKKDLMVTDSNGKIIKINFPSDLIYQAKPEQLLGENVFELDHQGILNHTATKKAIMEKKKVSVIHDNKVGNKLLITGVPLFEDNEIKYVISYGTWDFDLYDHILLEEKYRELQYEMERYTTEIKDLRNRELKSINVNFKDKKMQNNVKISLKVAEVNTNVLITGESGVGKNVFAKLIHSESFCKEGPFVEINCGAIPESLLESELFGYERGAFTGALQRGKIGKIELAQGGTLFLDEIGELPLNMQVKLLQVIQEKKITKIGGTQPINVDFRLISATNKDLKEMVDKHLFREDLFYRLNVVPINIPPLRERPDDLLLLILNLLEKTNSKFERNKLFSQDVLECMLKYKWPGNIRELENFIERLVLTVEEDYITLKDLPDSMFFNKVEVKKEECLTLTQAVEQYERNLVEKAYEKYKTSVGVSKALGISQATAVRKIHKYNLLQ